MTDYEIIMRKYTKNDCIETVYHEDSCLATIMAVRNLLTSCNCGQRVDVVAYEKGTDNKVCEASFAM